MKSVIRDLLNISRGINQLEEAVAVNDRVIDHNEKPDKTTERNVSYQKSCRQLSHEFSATLADSTTAVAE